MSDNLQPLIGEPSTNMASGQQPRESGVIVPTPEVPAVPVKTPEEAKQEERLSSKFASLTKKEKEIRAKELEIKTLSKSMDEERKKIAEERKEYETWKAKKARAKESPWEYLEEGGLTYDELTQAALSGKRPAVRDPRTDSALSEIEKIKRDMELSQKAAQEREEKAAINEWKSEAKRVAETTPEKYEAIRTFNAFDVVYQVADEKYRADGTQLSYEEALDIVEDYYASELDALLAKASSLNKFKSKFSAQPAKPADAAKASKDSNAKNEPSTLTNDLTAHISPADLPMDSHERLMAVSKLIK